MVRETRLQGMRNPVHGCHFRCRDGASGSKEVIPVWEEVSEVEMGFSSW